MLAIYHFVQNFLLTLVTHKELLKILNQHRHSIQFSHNEFHF